MGYFKEINLYNYRNFENFFLEFKNGCNIILGKNGSGKTNILESLSLLEKGRGFRKEKIENLINFNNRHKDFKFFFYLRMKILILIFQLFLQIKIKKR